MYDCSNEEIAKNVGQDKTTKDVVEVYDSSRGSYKGQEPMTKPGEHKQIPAPFTLGGE